MSSGPSRRHFLLGMFAGLFAFFKPRPAAATRTHRRESKELSGGLSTSYASYDHAGQPLCVGQTSSCAGNGGRPVMTITTYDRFGRITRDQTLLCRCGPQVRHG
jgi:hypothetical protein